MGSVKERRIFFLKDKKKEEDKEEEEKVNFCLKKHKSHKLLESE